jgi:hypothetical protein
MYPAHCITGVDYEEDDNGDASYINEILRTRTMTIYMKDYMGESIKMK